MVERDKRKKTGTKKLTNAEIINENCKEKKLDINYELYHYFYDNDRRPDGKM